MDDLFKDLGIPFGRRLLLAFLVIVVALTTAVIFLGSNDILKWAVYISSALLDLFIFYLIVMILVRGFAKKYANVLLILFAILIGQNLMVFL